MDVKLKIRMVLLMAKFESPTKVLRLLKSEGFVDLPAVASISNVSQNFCEFGTVLDLPRPGRPKISEENSTCKILEVLDENDESTLTEISAQTNLSRSTVQRRIKCNIGKKSCKIEIHQELLEEDFDRRVELAEKLLPILNDHAYKDLIFFSDEAQFHLSGRLHKQNCRIWAYEKPIVIRTEPLQDLKINVWCAMSSSCIIGPYFFDQSTVTGESYLQMLEYFFHPILVRKRIVQIIIFQQDGAPPHYSSEVRN